RHLSVLQRVYQHFHRLAAIWGNKNRGGQQAAANPGLSGVRQAVATEERKTQPALALNLRRQLLERLAGPDGHGIVLSRDQVDVGLLRSSELQPRSYRALCA